MRTGRSWRRELFVSTAVTVGVAMAMPASAWAAGPGKGGGGSHGGGGGGGTSVVGSDISWPQCGGSYPSGQAFGIVGVNGGVASDFNACFTSELTWAQGSSGASTQPKASLYVNTGDPGNSYNGQPVSDWPTSGGNSTYGTCTTTTGGLGADSTACAWQYGYDKATADVAEVGGAAVAQSYPWWLDVETANSWQTGTYGLQMNVADLQGMKAGLAAAGIAGEGVYSTSYQWSTITGGDTADFAGSPDWVPGARTERGAKSNCGLAAFTGGASKVVLTQWSGSFDYDYPCP